LAASSVATRLSVRRLSGLLGKCNAQNHRKCSGPLELHRCGRYSTPRRIRCSPRAVLVDPGGKAGTAHGERHQPAHALTTTVTSPVCFWGEPRTMRAAHADECELVHTQGSSLVVRGGGSGSAGRR
jgi:hypothetical protein